MGTDLDTLEAKRAGDGGYKTWCEYWDDQISEAVLGETLSTNIRGGGSRAAAEVHSEMTDHLVDADGDLQTGTLGGSLIAWLTAYNYPGARVPQVWRPRPENEGEIEEVKTKRANRRSKDMESLRKARAEGYEPADLDTWMSEVWGTEMARVAPTKTGDQKGDDQSFAAPGDDQIADLLDNLDAAIAPIIDSWIDDVRRVIMAGDAPVSLLAESVAGRRLAPFAEILGDGLALAELIGRSEVLDEIAETADAADSVPGNLVFQEQLEFFRQKVNLPTARWTDTLHQAHDRAFVVAGATSDELLADFRVALDKAMAEGGTLADFRKNFDRIVDTHRWRYNGDRNWRSRVIFETNIRTAHQAGRLKQMRHPDVVKLRPYWDYVHAQIRQPKIPRAEHVDWDGLVLPHDHPRWLVIFPPNGWRCSCGVRTLSKRDLERRGKTGPDDPPPLVYRKVKDPATGEMVEVPEGVDFGWGYAPGETWERGLVPRELQAPLKPAGKTFRPDDLVPLADLAKPFKSSRLADSLSEEDYVRAFLTPFGADIGRGALWRDRAGQTVVASDQLFKTADGRWKVLKRGRNVELARLAESIQDPDEIWVDWAQGPDGMRLVRRYLRFDPETMGYVMFEWAGGFGWYGLTALTPRRGRQNKPDDKYLEKARRGALIYRRPK